MIQRYDWGEDGMLDFTNGDYMLVKDHELEVALIGSTQIATIARIKKKLAIAVEALSNIGEYWNGGVGSAVDAAEHCRDLAEETLEKIKGEA